MNTALKRLSAIGLSAALLGGFTACASQVENAIDQVQEKATQAANDVLGEGSDVQFDSGDGVALPSTWPSNLPTPPGKITAAVAAAGSQNVTTNGASIAELKTFIEDAKTAGYSETVNVSTESNVVATLTQGAASVSIVGDANSALFTLTGL